MRAKSMNF